MLNIVDLSSNNGPVDLAKLKSAGADGVIIKATEGTGYINPYFKGQIEQAIRLGMCIGAYHFFSGTNATGNVNHFVEVVKPYKNHIGKFFADYEGTAITLGGVNYGYLALQMMKQKLGHTPTIYMGLSDENSHNWGSCTNYPLWIAQYNDMQAHYGFHPRSLYGSLHSWKKEEMFQYSATSYIGGYGPLDASIYYGTKANWNWNVKGGTAEMSSRWKAPVEFDDLGAFKVQQKGGAVLWSDAENTKKLGTAKQGTVYRITKMDKGFYKIAGKDEWLDPRTGDFHGNPIYYNSHMHAKIVVVKTTAGHAELTTKVTGKKFAVGTTWKMFGYKTFKSPSGSTWHWARVGAGNNTYINLDKCRVLV